MGVSTAVWDDLWMILKCSWARAFVPASSDSFFPNVLDCLGEKELVIRLGS